MARKPVKKIAKKKVVAAAKKTAKKKVARRRAQQLELLSDERPENSAELNATTLRPGYLVGLKTSVKGGVSYNKETIEARHRVRGAEKEKWQTERTVDDPEEFIKANQVRMRARQIIGSVCAVSAFGWLCPEANLQKLQLAIKDARREVERFNQVANHSNVQVYVITGRVARDDVEAVRAINSEVRDLLSRMATGIKDLNVNEVRKAANQARNLGSMLTPEAAEKIKAAIETARGAARKIIKAGETTAQEIDREAIRAVNSARTAFLDIDPDASEVALPDTEARAVDFHAGAETEAAETPEEGAGEDPGEEPARSAPPRRRTAPTAPETAEAEV